MTNQLKAFTILEALLSLMILSVVVSLSYLMFSLFNKQMVILENENTAVLQYNLFNNTIKYDINASNDHYISNNIINLKRYDKSEVMYVFNKDYILRQKTKNSDTFKLKSSSFQYNRVGSDPNSKRITINLELLNENIVSHYHLNKNVSKTINSIYFNED